MKLKLIFLVLAVLILGELYAKPFTFPCVPGTPCWDTAGSSWDRILANQIPENILGSMSTDDLVQTILHFPYLFEINNFDNMKNWYSTQTGRFNAFKELSLRFDATEILLKRYIETPISEKLLPNLIYEGVLAQDFVINNLNREQKLNLLKLSIDKFTPKIELRSSQKEFSYFTGVYLLAKLMNADNNCEFKNLLVTNTNLFNFVKDGYLRNKDDQALILLEAIKYNQRLKGDE